MKVRIESSKLIKPLYKDTPSMSVQFVTLSVFDKVSEESNIAAIFAFRPPTPSNLMVQKGLAKVLAEYPEWAGRLSKDAKGNPIIILDDKGARFIEATVSSATLDEAMPFDPHNASQSLHPSKYNVEALLQVQLTRFACGSLVIGYTMQHRVADGTAAAQFLVSWGRACRGANITGTRGSNIHDRAMLFKPQDKQCNIEFEFNHRGVEFATAEEARLCMNSSKGNIVMHKAHFPRDFLKRLKIEASRGLGLNQSYTTFESLAAHLWRVMTVARRLQATEMTNCRISVNGRTRLSPDIIDAPNLDLCSYFGNLALWAYPRATAQDLVSRPLQYAVQLIHNEVKKVNHRYFKSFIDFATSKAIEERLVPVPEPPGRDMLRNVDVDSLLGFPLCDLDFGTGCPFFFMPSHIPIEGAVMLLPSLLGDGSIDAYVPLSEHNLARFECACYSLHLDLTTQGDIYRWGQEEGISKESFARL